MAIWDSWLLPSLGLLAALECVTIIVIGRRSLGLARAQTALQVTLADLSARLDEVPTRQPWFREMVESDPDPVVCRDPSGRILFANDAFGALMQEDSARLVGTRRVPVILEATAPRNLDDGSRAIDEAIVQGAGLRWIAWVERDLAGPDGTACTWRRGRDVSERVAAERDLENARAGAEAASAAKSRFLATVSHEFRTPLNGIIGMSDLLQDTLPTPQQASHIRTIRGSAEAFLGLIEQVLDFSTIEAGRLYLRAEPVDLVDLVEGVAELLAPRAHGRGIDIATWVSSDVPRHVTGDRDRLRQILLNLGGNAVKFTRQGGVAIRVERGGADKIRFSVEDSGPGIPPERHDAIFEEFEQGGAGTRGHHEGTGLGLAITRRLAEAMSASLTLESEPGVGTIFQVEIDLPEACAQERRVLPDCRGQRVLVVSSSALGSPLLLRRLADAGATARGAESAADACLALSQSSFDVLIADLALGEGSLREIAGAATEAGVPRRIVMLSPYEQCSFDAARLPGYESHLTKPIRTRSLRQQVAPTRASRQPAQAEPGPPVEPPRAFLRVLLAEDNDVNALIAIRALEKVGATADWARTGPEALALAEEAIAGGRPPYDVALMDIRLPELDGFAVTRRIRESEARHRVGGLRIVALSANLAASDRNAARAAGLDDVLPKPFTLDMLRAALLLDGDHRNETQAQERVARAS